MKSRWSSGLWMSFAPLAAAWGPRRGKRGSREVAASQAAPRVSAPLSLPRLAMAFAL